MPVDFDISLEPLLNKNTVVQGYLANDQSFDGASTTYFGFTDRNGNWYIQKQVVTGNDISWRYARGAGAYSTNWTGRVGLTYDYFDVVF